MACYMKPIHVKFTTINPRDGSPPIRSAKVSFPQPEGSEPAEVAQGERPPEPKRKKRTGHLGS